MGVTPRDKLTTMRGTPRQHLWCPVLLVSVVHLLVSITPSPCAATYHNVTHPPNNPTAPTSTSWRETSASTPSSLISTLPTPSGRCQDRFGSFPPPVFRLRNCAFCLRYVYYNSVPFRLGGSLHLILTNATGFIVDVALPDPDKAGEVQKVCRAVERAGHDCQRWLACCEAVQACCRRQQSQQALSPARVEDGRARAVVPRGAGDSLSSRGGVDEGASRFCPSTWDGFSCWDDTPAGKSVTTQCASYINEYSYADAYAEKQCNENGTWYTHPDSGLEWTDYTTCTPPTKHMWAIFWVSILCHAVSLLLLLPACLTFLYFRSLRNQPRVRLHTCLFSSYVIRYLMLVLTDGIFLRDRLTVQQDDQPLLHQDTVGCRVLHVLTRYGGASISTWLFLESLYLYRLMSHAFEHSKSLLLYYLAGFGVPWISVITYSIIRTSVKSLNTRCWVGDADVPNILLKVYEILCLVGSLGFLFRTLHIMMTQLQSHPNEPSNFRRALKAFLMLVPLFGLQSLLYICQPKHYSVAFDIIRILLSGTQGAIVAVVFCYLNGEVLAIYRNAIRLALTRSSRPSPKPRHSESTQMTTDISSRSLVSFTHQPPSRSQSPAGEGTADEESRVPLPTVGTEDRHPPLDDVEDEQGKLNGSV